MTWTDLASWWQDELVSDPAYEEEVAPLVLDLLGPVEGRVILDAGCGEGRMMRAISSGGGTPVGVDSQIRLLAAASNAGPVVASFLPSLGCFRSQIFDGVMVSLVLEHLEDAGTFLAESARVTRPGGVLAVVANHPIFTAPNSAPIQETDEVLWRPGAYFSKGFTDEPAGDGTIRFHHRGIGDLLTMASEAGWDLHRLVEQGVSDRQVDRHPPLDQQRHIPRLLGGRWVRRVSIRP